MIQVSTAERTDSRDIQQDGSPPIGVVPGVIKDTDSPSLNVKENPAIDTVQLPAERGSETFKKRFVGLNPQGFALGMHVWGAERAIAVQAALFGYENYQTIDQSTFRFTVSGSVIEKGNEGRTGYWAGFTLNGFPNKDLPPNKPMSEGLTLKSNDGATLNYSNGQLTLTKQATLSYNPFPLVWREVQEVSVLKIEVSPDLSQAGAGELTVTKTGKKLFGGFKEPKTVTSVSFGDSVDSKDPAALAAAVASAKVQGKEAVKSLLLAAFNR